MEITLPENHLLRIINTEIDFNFIYDEVENLYSEKGRTDIDPLSLFKIVFIQYVFGIRSMRQTIKEIEVNVAYRWFIGKRKETVERVFADAKERHSLRYTNDRGLPKVKFQVTLIFACLNKKNWH